MRKVQQRRILEILGTLHDAHKELRKHVSLNVYINLLATCQDCALAVMENIVSIEGEGTKTAGLLDEYCKILFIASTAGQDSANTNSQLLENKLIDIEKSVRNNLQPNRIEIVFFPYQLSMWDSLESVYLAAKADPHADVYCVPIPWYEKLSDGCLGQQHYDGDKYPTNIKVTDWREYDVKERHPDIIFIHNPYDEGNHVTSVHPYYYSKRLRECTDLLCYIPYFVAVDDVPEHLVITASCIYAHRIFLQSEKVRDTYINVFGKAFGNRFGKASEKFVALGSPKFDKVLSTKREDCVLPETWDKLITKSDGTRKKVVLFNTTIDAILHGNEQYLEKLRFVLDVFKGRDDVVLWWRPHPLSMQTFDSMRAQLAAEYKQIVGEYRREGYGIYDSTSDLHRAIALSDAYYGDISSLVALYEVTGKPIMIQSLVLPERKTLIDISPGCICDSGESFWFTANGFNGLFKLVKKTGEYSFIGAFPGEMSFGKQPFSSVVQVSDTLYFAPLLANKIHTYNIPSGEFGSINIKFPLIRQNHMQNFVSEAKFSLLLRDNEDLFFLPARCEAILKFNVKNGDVAYKSDWIERLESTRINDDWYFKDAAIVDRKAVISCACSEMVLVLDLDSMQYELMESKGKSNSYLHSIDPEAAWLAGDIQETLFEDVYRQLSGVVPNGKDETNFPVKQVDMINLLPSDVIDQMSNKLAEVIIEKNLSEHSTIRLTDEICFRDIGRGVNSFIEAVINQKTIQTSSLCHTRDDLNGKNIYDKIIAMRNKDI